MRESLYRGKKYETSIFDETDWIYGSLIDSGNHGQVAIYPWIDGASTMSVRQLVYARMKAVKPETVGQFTGLTDKNGKKIFEWDIVKIGGHAFLVNGLYLVVYDTANHCWGLQRSTEYHHHYFTFSDLNGFEKTSKVIGNIHDNPKLLKGLA